MGHPIYHLELEATDCRAEARLNGFPVLSLSSANGVAVRFAPPVNPYLCGARNQLEVTLHAATRPSGDLTTFGDAAVRGNVRRFEKGGIVAPGTGTIVVEFGITDELRDRVRDEKLELPISFSVPFGNEAVDFSAELLEAPAFDDTEALLDYALRLRDMVAAGDAAAITAEAEPKSRVWSLAYARPAQEYDDALRDALGEFFGGRPIADFGRDDVELTRCCDGRIWRLARRPGQPLLESVLADKSRRRIPVHVGVRDGSLRVVR
ncbi:MAG TPA: hypothetical protein VEB43_03950 [Anaeromyxobacter sp.]|nr:hypothetical protein [Anaeromyxobacter sp.]